MFKLNMHDLPPEVFKSIFVIKNNFTIMLYQKPVLKTLDKIQSDTKIPGVFSELCQTSKIERFSEMDDS